MANPTREHCPHIQQDGVTCSHHECCLLLGEPSHECCIYCALARDCPGVCDTALDPRESLVSCETSSGASPGSSAIAFSEARKEDSGSLPLLPHSTNRPEKPTVVMVELRED